MSAWPRISRRTPSSPRSSGGRRRELEAERERTGAGFDRDFYASLDDDIGDDLLRLVFIACHPILSTEARAEIERAASLTRNAGERTLLLERAASCVTRSTSSHRS
jgi:predicted RNA polymerase sigma factor